MEEGEAQEEVVEVEGVVVASAHQGHPGDLTQAGDHLVITVIEAEFTTTTLMVLLTLLLHNLTALEPI